MKTHTVICSYEFPSIPIRDFDWHACLDGDQETGPYGNGATKEAAVYDLMGWLEVDDTDRIIIE